MEKRVVQQSTSRRDFVFVVTFLLLLSVFFSSLRSTSDAQQIPGDVTGGVIQIQSNSINTGREGITAKPLPKKSTTFMVHFKENVYASDANFCKKLVLGSLLKHNFVLDQYFHSNVNEGFLATSFVASKSPGELASDTSLKETDIVAILTNGDFFESFFMGSFPNSLSEQTIQGLKNVVRYETQGCLEDEQTPPPSEPPPAPIPQPFCGDGICDYVYNSPGGPLPSFYEDEYVCPADCQSQDEIDDENEGDDDSEDDFEPDETGYYQLAQSVPLIKADLVQDPLQNDNTGEGAIVCIIDSGLNYGLHLPKPLNYTYKGKEILHTFNAGGTIIGPDGKKVKGDYGALEHVTDTLGHGTVMAEIVASYDTGKVGVAPGASLMIVRLSDLDPKKSELNKALKYCLGKNKANQRADVVLVGVAFLQAKKNNFDVDLYTDTLSPIKGKGNIKSTYKIIFYSANVIPKKKISATNAQLIPVVVPAGNVYAVKNLTKEGVQSLAALDNTLSVGAVYDGGTDITPSHTWQDFDLGSPGNILQCSDGPPADPIAIQSKQVICLSACDDQLLDISAPGWKIITTNPASPFAVVGTSAASAHVAGTIALMKAQALKEGKVALGGSGKKQYSYINLTLSQVKQALFSTVDKAPITTIGPATCYGNGVVDAKGAVDAV